MEDSHNNDHVGPEAEVAEDSELLRQLEVNELPCNSGVLFVRVHEGAQLAAHDRDGKSDPYCVALINGEKVWCGGQGKARPRSFERIFS